MEGAVRSRWIILVAVSLCLVVADQWTKYLAVKHLTPGIAQAEAGASELLTPERVHEINADVDLLTGLGHFYGSVRHPCRRAGRALCPTVDVVDGFWAFKYRENPGAAWGLLATADESIRVPFFLVMSFGALVLIVVFYRRLTDDQHLLIWALALVFGGALGNLLDRLHLNYVVDFIDWYVGNNHWPTFNVADSGITSGVVLLMLEWLRDAVRSSKKTTPAESP